MNTLQIIREKNGRIIKLANDVFEENTLECEKSHTFKLYQNDILMGKWCPECKNKIQEILDSLSIKYIMNAKVGDYNYDFVIEGGRKFVIFSKENGRQDMIENASRKDFNVIVVENENEEDLGKKIWDCIKNNNKLTQFLEKKEEKRRITHNCILEEKLGNEKEDSGSVIKFAPEPHPLNMKKVIGYIRVSTVMQVQDGFSLEAQETKIYNESVKMNGFLKSLYIDRGISGGSIEKRLSLEKMLKSIESGDWIIVNSVSRLARKTKDLLSIVEIIESKKCHLMILDLNLDITSPSGKLILTMMGSQAQFEREITSERVKGVLQHLKSTGCLRTKPPFGWKMNIDHSVGAAIHVREEGEQLIIQKIRNLRSKCNDIPITTFTEVLNREKIKPPRNSKKWYHKHVKEIMIREGIK